MEETHRIGDGILDQHGSRISRDPMRGRRYAIVGQPDGWLIVTELLDEELEAKSIDWKRSSAHCMGGRASRCFVPVCVPFAKGTKCEP